jgi:hypothetical protein
MRLGGLWTPSLYLILPNPTLPNLILPNLILNNLMHVVQHLIFQ